MTQRRFSIWRLLLALVLLTIAVIVFTTWRRSAILLLYYEEFVGFDEPHGLFYTTSKAGPSQELHCYELATGAMRSTVAMKLPSQSDPANIWPCQFTPDKRHLIAVSGLLSQFHILGMSDMQPVPFDSLVDHKQNYRAMGLTPDGKTLLLLTYHNKQNLIQILDLEWKSTREFTVPVEYDQIEYDRKWGFHYGNQSPDLAIDMTADRRLVAFCSTDKEHVIYDLSQNQVVLRVKADGDFVRFSEDGLRVVFHAASWTNTTTSWYEVRDGKWQLNAKKQLPFQPLEEACQVTSRYMITARDSYRNLGWLERLPGRLTNYLDKIVPHQPIHIRYWDIWTGEPLTEFCQEYPSAYIERYTGPRSTFGTGRYFKRLREDVSISSDGRYLAWDQGMILSLWETNPRRPLLCWLICSGLVLLGVWIAKVRHQPREHSIPLIPQCT